MILNQKENANAYKKRFVVCKVSISLGDDFSLWGLKRFRTTDPSPTVRWKRCSLLQNIVHVNIFQFVNKNIWNASRICVSKKVYGNLSPRSTSTSQYK